MFVPAKKHHQALVDWLKKNGHPAWLYPASGGYHVLTPERAAAWQREQRARNQER